MNKEKINKIIYWTLLMLFVIFTVLFIHNYCPIVDLNDYGSYDDEYTFWVFMFPVLHMFVCLLFVIFSPYKKKDNSVTIAPVVAITAIGFIISRTASTRISPLTADDAGMMFLQLVIILLFLILELILICVVRVNVTDTSTIAEHYKHMEKANLLKK